MANAYSWLEQLSMATLGITGALGYYGLGGKKAPPQQQQQQDAVRDASSTADEEAFIKCVFGLIHVLRLSVLMSGSPAENSLNRPRRMNRKQNVEWVECAEEEAAGIGT
jgi:hypothetical protein